MLFLHPGHFRLDEAEPRHLRLQKGEGDAGVAGVPAIAVDTDDDDTARARIMPAAEPEGMNRRAGAQAAVAHPALVPGMVELREEEMIQALVLGMRDERTDRRQRRRQPYLLDGAALRIDDDGTKGVHESIHQKRPAAVAPLWGVWGAGTAAGPRQRPLAARHGSVGATFPDEMKGAPGPRRSEGRREERPPLRCRISPGGRASEAGVFPADHQRQASRPSRTPVVPPVRSSRHWRAPAQERQRWFNLFPAGATGLPLVVC